jgi:hypothetical protein
MATVAEWQATYAVLKAKYDAASAAAGPTYTVPGGATLDRMKYLRELREEMKAISDMVPGVAPESHPTFEVLG